MLLPGIASKWPPKEPPKLQVTILNVRGSAATQETEGGPAAGLRVRQSRLYCTCAVPEKPLSHFKTPVQISEISDSGWNAVWNFTSDVPEYVVGDSLGFIVWEKDQTASPRATDLQQCSGTDCILGRGILTSAELVPLSAPGSPTSGMSSDADASSAASILECELPLQDTASGMSAWLHIRVSAAPASHGWQSGWQRQHSQATSVFSGSQNGPPSPDRDPPPSPAPPSVVITDATGMEEPRERAFADAVARTAASMISTTFQRLLASHVQGLEATLLAAQSKSERQVLTAIASAASRSKRRPSASGVKRSVSRGSYRLNTANSTDGAESVGTASNDSADFFTQRAHTDQPKIEVSAERGRHPHPETPHFAGTFHEEIRTSRKASPHPDHDDEKAPAWKTKDSRKSNVGKSRQTFGDMDSLQTNRILESFGLVSGPHGSGKAGRRPSLTEMFTRSNDDEGKKKHSRGRDKKDPVRHGSRCNTGESYMSMVPNGSDTREDRIRPNARRGDSPTTSYSRGPGSASSNLAMILGTPLAGQAEQEQEGEGKRTSEEGLRSDTRSESTSSPRTSAAEVLPRVAEVSTTSQAYRPTLSTSSVDKLRRARVKIGFLSALKKTAEKDIDKGSSFASESAFEAVASDRSKAFSDFSSHRPGPSQFQSETSHEMSSVYHSLDSLSEGHFDGQQTSKSTLEVPPKRGSGSPTAAGRRTSNEVSYTKRDSDKFRPEASDASKLDIDMEDFEVPGQTPMTSEMGSAPSKNHWATAQSRSISLGASQSINGARLSLDASLNMRYLRVEQEEKIMHKSTSMNLREGSLAIHTASEEEFRSAWLPTLVMVINGIMSPQDWRVAEAIFLSQLLLVLGTLVVSVKFVIDGSNAPYSGVASAILSAGALWGLISLRTRSIMDIAIPLERYAVCNTFHQDWMSKSRRSCYTLLMVWIAAVLFQFCLPLVSSQVQCADGISEAEGPTRWPTQLAKRVFPCCVFAHTSAIFAALLYCQFHILACLELMLDSFCRRLFEECELLESFVSEWNIVQAILRRSARTVENCFVIVQTSAFCALVLSGLGLWQDAPRTCGSEWVMLVMEHAPVLVLGLAALLLFCKGAAVTEQCTRVPSLINSMELDDPVDETRQYVVSYVINSDAGFYVRDVRLTSFMALKITYIFFAAVLGLIVQLLRM